MLREQYVRRIGMLVVPEAEVAFNPDLVLKAFGRSDTTLETILTAGIVIPRRQVQLNIGIYEPLKALSSDKVQALVEEDKSMHLSPTDFCRSVERIMKQRAEGKTILHPEHPNFFYPKDTVSAFECTIEIEKGEMNYNSMDLGLYGWDLQNRIFAPLQVS